jgi:hypothetical protein
MISLDDARRVALSLPEAAEQDHHGRASFRVRGKIFATVPDPGRLNVFVDPDEVPGLVGEWPDACAELWWGKQLRGVSVDLDHADPAVVAELLSDAWRRKAPTTLRTHGPPANRRGTPG